MLSVEEVDAPPIGPGEVRVRLRVAGVNPTDWKCRGGVCGGRGRCVAAQPPVRYPLAQVAQAHDRVEAGAPGKVLLDLP